MNENDAKRAEEARRKLAAALGAPAPVPRSEDRPPLTEPNFLPTSIPEVPKRLLKMHADHVTPAQTRHAKEILEALALPDNTPVLKTINDIFPLKYLRQQIIVAMGDRLTRVPAIKSVLELYKIALMGTQILDAKGGAPASGPRLLSITASEADLPTTPAESGTETPGAAAG